MTAVRWNSIFTSTCTANMTYESVIKALEIGLFKPAPQRNGSYKYIETATVDELRGICTILHAKYKGKDYYATFTGQGGFVAPIGRSFVSSTLTGLAGEIMPSGCRISGLLFWRDESNQQTVGSIVRPLGAKRGPTTTKIVREEMYFPLIC